MNLKLGIILFICIILYLVAAEQSLQASDNAVEDAFVAAEGENCSAFPNGIACNSLVSHERARRENSPKLNVTAVDENKDGALDVPVPKILDPKKKHKKKANKDKKRKGKKGVSRKGNGGVHFGDDDGEYYDGDDSDYRRRRSNKKKAGHKRKGQHKKKKNKKHRRRGKGSKSEKKKRRKNKSSKLPSDENLNHLRNMPGDENLNSLHESGDENSKLLPIPVPDPCDNDPPGPGCVKRITLTMSPNDATNKPVNRKRRKRRKSSKTRNKA